MARHELRGGVVGPICSGARAEHRGPRRRGELGAPAAARAVEASVLLRRPHVHVRRLRGRGRGQRSPDGAQVRLRRAEPERLGHRLAVAEVQRVRRQRDPHLARRRLGRAGRRPRRQHRRLAAATALATAAIA